MNVKKTIEPIDYRYRYGVGLMVINRSKNILVGKRIDKRNECDEKEESWQMPQGGMKYLEAPHEAAMRELKEEIGTDCVRIVSISNYWYSYDFPEELQKVLWGGRFFGQTQKWYLVELLSEEDDINLSDCKNPEFSEWKWTDQESIIKQVINFKKDLYKNVLEEFSNFIN